MSYNLFGFNPKSFERFVGTIAAHVFGAGVAVYGSGPDGGREATFQGQVPYPFDGDRWSGYGVIQAKFKERAETSSKDQKWALDQLETELKQFTASKRRHPKPEYYVFVTNVVLSPVVKTGGKDKANAIIQRYYGKLPLKGHAVWDADQLAFFLDKYIELRRTYSAYTTLGDVLHTLSESVRSRTPQFSQIATQFLERQLREEVGAKLDQAGQRTDQFTPLAKVFIDLPVDFDDEHNSRIVLKSTHQKYDGFVAELLDVGSSALDPLSLEVAQACAQKDTDKRQTPSTNRYVLIGGAGSGKSTVGQYLAQIHRAALLQRVTDVPLPAATRQTIKEIRTGCESDGLPWPATPRYVFRIELSAYAKAISNERKGQPPTLLQYLADSMSGDHKITAENLGEWLSLYPWLVVFDGLDEVPSSSNRDQVCKSIQDFLAITIQKRADMLVLATTRREGYNDEFGVDGSFEYRFLQPLSVKRALTYVRRFAAARYGVNSARVDEIETTLEEAARNDLTAKLMRTPLQVTFMATLVAAGGRPPKDRWRLFRDYFETIYKREQQKGDSILREVLDLLGTQVRWVHFDAGFLLQVRGEMEGGTDASMTALTFLGLVATRLERDGFEDKERKEHVAAIAEVSTYRLVFLSSHVKGQISFDVRSLQEYMAAERVTQGDDGLVRARLRRIAAIPYWRNVVLFAAGKYFADPDRDHLRSIIWDACLEANQPETDRASALCLSGSYLALEILEDGSVLQIPILARQFATLALGLLDHSPLLLNIEAGDKIFERLARLHNDRLTGVFQTELKRRCGHTDPITCTSAWLLLLTLLNRGNPWAEELANLYWPSDPVKQWRIANNALKNGIYCSWLFQKVATILPYRLPDRRWSRHTEDVLCASPETPEWLKAAVMLLSTESPSLYVLLSIPGLGGQEIRLKLNPLDNRRAQQRGVQRLEGRQRRSGKALWRQMKNIPGDAAEWKLFKIAGEFAEKPSSKALATALEAVATNCTPNLWRLYAGTLPWPLASSLMIAEDAQDALHIAAASRNGELGERKDWLAAEKRWATHGISLDDLNDDCPSDLPFGATIADRGFPFTSGWRYTHSNAGNALGQFLSLFMHAKSERSKILLASWVVVSMKEAIGIHGYLPYQVISPEIMRRVFEVLPFKAGRIAPFLVLDWPEQLDQAWIDVLDDVGRHGYPLGLEHLRGLDFRDKCAHICEQMAAAYVTDPKRTGLLPLLSGCALEAIPVYLPQRVLQPRRIESLIEKQACTLLKIHLYGLEESDLDDIYDMLDNMEYSHSKVRDYAEGLSKAIARSSRPLSFRENELMALHDKTNEKWPVAGAVALTTLRTMVRMRNSGLSEATLCKELDLPFRPHSDLQVRRHSETDRGWDRLSGSGF